MNNSTWFDDAALPAVGLLMGRQSEDLLDAVMSEAGGRRRSHKVSQVRYVPDRRITVQYRVDVTWSDGRPSSEMIVATSGTDVPADVPVFATDGVEIAVWRFPNDPFLPGLAIASDSKKAAGLLGQLGAPAEEADVRVRSYRAMRRAVIEITTAGHRLFVKVVRPDRIATLQRIHEELSAHVPVPRSFGWSSEHGVIALEAMAGRTLKKALESRTTQLPEATAIVGLLDEIPPPSSASAPVAGPRARVAEHGRLLTAVSPELSDRVDAIAGRLYDTSATASDPVHGDFHSAQILTSGADIIGLVDVDTAGSGSRVNDLASLLGQLATLSLVSRSRQPIERYGAALIDVFDHLADPIELRLRTAAAVFGLATGPFRVQLPRWPAQTEKRLALAEQWIRSADDLQ